MKHSQKPFSVEIKRSRRIPAGAASVVANDAREPHALVSHASSAPRSASKPQASAKRAAGGHAAPRAAEPQDFAIPAFLQTDKRTIDAPLDAHLQEAERLFRRADARSGPSVAQAADKPVAPRILPSLLPGENPASVEAPEPPPRRRPGRPRLVRPEAEAAPAASETKRPRGRPRGSRSVPKAVEAPAAPRPAPAAERVEAILFSPSDAGPRRRVRRAMEEVAALPRGQQWKRRLQPRALRP